MSVIASYRGHESSAIAADPFKILDLSAPESLNVAYNNDRPVLRMNWPSVTDPAGESTYQVNVQKADGTELPAQTTVKTDLSFENSEILPNVALRARVGVSGKDAPHPVWMEWVDVLPLQVDTPTSVSAVYSPSGTLTVEWQMPDHDDSLAPVTSISLYIADSSHNTAAPGLSTLLTKTDDAELPTQVVFDLNKLDVTFEPTETYTAKVHAMVAPISYSDWVSSAPIVLGIGAMAIGSTFIVGSDETED